MDNHKPWDPKPWGYEDDDKKKSEANLSEAELENVTKVFKVFETGLRTATIESKVGILVH